MEEDSSIKVCCEFRAHIQQVVDADDGLIE